MFVGITFGMTQPVGILEYVIVGLPRSLKKNDASAPAPVDTNPKPVSSVTRTSTLLVPSWNSWIVPIFGAPVEHPPVQWSDVKIYVAPGTAVAIAGTLAKPRIIITIRMRFRIIFVFPFRVYFAQCSQSRERRNRRKADLIL